MDLVEIRAEIAVDSVEMADAAMLELGIAGWSIVEDVIVRRAWIVGIFSDGREARERWAELLPFLGKKPLAKEMVRTLADAEWRDCYKAHFKAWRFDRLHWVPTWERQSYILPPGDKVLWLDPGMAFGTGNHETTRLCVERLVTLDAELVAAGGDRTNIRVVDAGCGSGILALSAAKLGYRDVAGFDNDPEAIQVSEANAASNGLADNPTFFVGDLITGLSGLNNAKILMANILADVLVRFGSELVAAVAPGGVLILSGILATENAEVRDAFGRLAPGWNMDSRVLGEWSDVVIYRPQSPK